ncbi:T9SS type B sorting domain-containing protein [Flaviramulus sp. BrNp1-15]|uniref:T9SS type B sorting domain-containing protein n=1 Tax=Flaviramulus sp. BrNp1-15 TaxID=2916754 RepID=UPI001EE95D75|nr:T9SS type B sorting domain-containing protein [Flaviramulus sp. BrNp1-15]ULC57928.1 T9SS type B sorting domain-containing protein [Flaviramulus sp. BrNp1-15]
MLKRITLYIFLLITFFALAQKETNIWYFGEYAGLDFNSGSPVALTDGQLNTFEGCATISDKNGKLLFYTDGRTVYNKNHDIMLNGEGLKGDGSSTHSGLIVPKPGDNNIYYIFTVDWHLGEDGIQYSEVDMRLDAGLGGINMNKNIKLFAPMSEKITAITGCNGNCVWVVTHKVDSNEFLSYKITNLGVDTTPIVSASGSYVYEGLNVIGAIKISPKGNRLAVANAQLNVQLFDFNSTTGEVNNPLTLLNENSADNATFYGIEFSPDGNVLYASLEFEGIYQFNLNYNSSDDILNSITELTQDPRGYGALQLAVDGKIYVSEAFSNYLHVINNPNSIGLASDYQNDAVFLEWRLAKNGLPPFIQSYFKVDAFDHDNNCYGDTTTFKLSDTVDSIVWNFGDPLSGANNTSTDFEPTHVFTSPGTYTVTVTATSGGETDTNEQYITIYELPIATQPIDLLVCDDDDDGFYSFDLTQQDAAILNGQDSSVFEVNYYASVADYTTNTPISNLVSYINTTAYTHETIIASIRNSNNIACDDITSFDIVVLELPVPNQNVSKISICDNTSVGADTDGLVEFNLTEKEEEILNGQSIADFKTNYFTDAALTNEITTPLQYINASVSETIYVQVINRLNNSCSATTQFDLEVLELPMVISAVELKQCDDDLDGFSNFNLNEVISKITSNAANETITFFETQTQAENNNSPITDITAYINQTVSNDVVWGRIENNNGCYRTSQIDLIVTTTQIPSTYTRDFYVCDDDIDGISQFDFNGVHSEIEAMFPSGQQLIINYYRNEADALAEENSISDISNYTNTGYPNSQQIYVRVDGQLDNDCLGLGAHINLYVEPIPNANMVTIDRQCDDNQDGEYPFDVSLVESTVLGVQSLSDVTVSYFDENDTALPSPLPNPFLTGSQVLKIRVSNNNVSDGSCFDETTLEFIVDKQPIAYPVSNIIVCDDGIDDADGLHDFDTSQIESTILNGQTDMEVHYYDESGTELSSPLPNPFLSASQTITVNVINPINNVCYDTTSFDLIVNPLPDFTVETPQIVCSSDPTFTVVLDPQEINSSEDFDYEWVYEDGTVLSQEPTLTVSIAGTYSVTLTKTDGTNCSKTREVFVNASELANITQNDIVVVDNPNNNTITINTQILGQGDYEFSLNDEFSNYQDEPFFGNIESGVHTIFIRDKKGCGTSFINVSVIGYPKFFTPNGDGTNDYWQVEGVSSQFQANSDIFIYNRYGKLIKQLATTSVGWDGTFNGNMLPTDDYWFRVYLEDGREFQGHFTLKR